ncbi:MAG: M36 family metallopeptidase [Saprospiraceae bacterium]|nr:M36 family metallopeptidase [Saprospiraceae bacterium]
MRQKIYIITIMCFIQTCLVFGQNQNKLDIALKYIEKNAKTWELNTSDFTDVQVSSSVTSNKGITYLYLNQTYDNIPVRNAMMTVIIAKNDEVVSVGNSFVSDLKSKISHNKKNLQPESAVLAAADHLGIQIKGRPQVSSRNDLGKYIIDLPELTRSPIPAELKYELKEDKLILVWNLNLYMKSNSDFWDINIDAADGSFVSKHNLTVYCKHHKDAFAKHKNCAIETYRKLNSNPQSVSNVLSAGNIAAKYNVFALPAESPNHGGRTIVTDDQFPAVSPFGWHDTNGVDGAEFFITKGNNVHAYQDKDNNDDSDGLDTDGGANLNFDFPIDLTKDPRQSADASVTNLFYMVNMMHDVTATLGFTEEFGNFQKKNYSGMALDGEDDYVLAQAFDGITLHEAKQDLDANGNPTLINNANFSISNDGFYGVMQMYFWDNDGGAISIDSPESIKGFIAEYGTAQFGGVIPKNTEPPTTGAVVIARDGSTKPTACCGPLKNGPEVSGKIALIDRGFVILVIKYIGHNNQEL